MYAPRPISAHVRPGSPRNEFAPMPPAGAPSPRYSPRSTIRQTSAPHRPASAAVRAGGRLYVQSPLIGMSENEMINEARIRMDHNKQRAQLKRLLSTAANGGTVINTRDLLLACRIAKLDVGAENAAGANNFLHPDDVLSRDYRGTPRQVLWKGFHKSLPYPELHHPGQYPGELPLTRIQKKQLKEYRDQLADIAAEKEAEDGGAELNFKPVAREEDVKYWHKMLRRCFETRFGELRRAFRLIDEDGSGDCDREELKHAIEMMFNLGIPEHVMDKIIDLADYDGDGQISFAEFARVATEEDVFNMKQTLQADVSGFGRKDAALQLAEIDRQKQAAQKRAAAVGGYAEGGYHPKLRKTGPGLDELRRAHKTIKKAVLARYPDFNTAFLSIDKDGSGTLRRAELRRFLATMVKTLSDRLISGLIDFCDDDGDGKSLSKGEFIKLMSADYLGAGGFDPNAHNIDRNPIKIAGSRA